MGTNSDGLLAFYKKQAIALHKEVDRTEKERPNSPIATMFGKDAVRYEQLAREREIKPIKEVLNER